MASPTVNLATAPLDRRGWFGHLTLENFDAVVERLRMMLDGKFYTFVAVNDALSDPQVRCSNKLLKPIDKTSKTLGDGRPWAHVTLVDGRYVWSLDTTCPDQQTAWRILNGARGRSKDEKSPEVSAYKDLTSLSFSHDSGGEQLRIEHFAPAGNHLTWVVAVEDHTDWAAE